MVVDDNNTDNEDNAENTYLDVLPSDEISSVSSIERLKNLINNCRKPGTIEPCKINVRRSHAFQDFEKFFSRKWNAHKIEKKIVVTFFEELAIDTGGPAREFFSLCLDHVKNTYFIEDGLTGGYEPILCYEDLTKNTYTLIGQLFALSIRQSGPAPSFLSPWVASYMCVGLEKIKIPPAISSSSSLAEMYRKVSQANSDKDLVDITTTDDGYNALSQIGYRGVPHKMTIENKESLLRSMFLASKHNIFPFIEQLKKGLELFGILPAIQDDYSSGLDLLSIKGSGLLKWNVAEFQASLNPIYSHTGSNRRQKEINVFKAFNDVIELIFHDESASAITLEDITMFITGSKSIPPLGLGRPIHILFKHGCNNSCRCLPNVSVCSPSLTLPVHYGSEETMLQALEVAVRCSIDFGNQ